VQHDSNTPDLTTGVYYEYDLKRTLILTNYKGRQVLRRSTVVGMFWSLEWCKSLKSRGRTSGKLKKL
jgi:hypothetical protein